MKSLLAKNFMANRTEKALWPVRQIVSNQNSRFSKHVVGADRKHKVLCERGIKSIDANTMLQPLPTFYCKLWISSYLGNK